MKCRRLKLEYDAGGNILRRDIVWFGSYGINHDGTAKFYNANNKHDNYATEKQAVADSLTQRLNVLQGELWYAVNTGFPLWDKHKNTNVLDIYITSTILKHPDVSEVIEFSSEITQKEGKNYYIYSANVRIMTKYGELTISTDKLIQ